jgi:hypothetical protein
MVGPMKLRNYPVTSAKTLTFTLDEAQVTKANRWMTRHRCTRKGLYGSAGDKVVFHFAPSGIGDFVSMRCSCGKEISLTGDL